MSGAGKTTVCSEFAKAGFDIVNCDVIARRLTEKGSPALQRIAARFGGEYLLPDGGLNRKALGGLVFSDKKSLEALNGIMYPYISYEVIDRINRSSAEYLLLDAPTLFESGLERICDVTVCVVCESSAAVERITRRDGIDAKAAADRLASQHGADFYRERCEYCIVNDSDISALVKKTEEIIRALKGKE